MSQLNIAYVGMGSNLSDPVQNLISAQRLIERLATCKQTRSSCLYLSSPVGYEPQPFFVNRVLEVSTVSTIIEFFEQLQAIENSLGRVRDQHNRNAPRIIDLDLLLFSNMQIENEILTVPHPRMIQRRFVVEPLLELNNQIKLPGGGLLIEQVEQARCADTYRGQTLHRLC